MKPNLLIVEIAITEHVEETVQFADDVVAKIEDLCICNTSEVGAQHSFFMISTRWDDQASPYKRCETCVNFADTPNLSSERIGVCTGFVGRAVPRNWSCADWSAR